LHAKAGSDLGLQPVLGGLQIAQLGGQESGKSAGGHAHGFFSWEGELSNSARSKTDMTIAKKSKTARNGHSPLDSSTRRGSRRPPGGFVFVVMTLKTYQPRFSGPT
jgi:hypothetical protein